MFFLHWDNKTVSSVNFQKTKKCSGWTFFLDYSYFTISSEHILQNDTQTNPSNGLFFSHLSSAPNHLTCLQFSYSWNSPFSFALKLIAWMLRLPRHARSNLTTRLYGKHEFNAHTPIELFFRTFHFSYQTTERRTCRKHVWINGGCEQGKICLLHEKKKHFL